MINHYEALVTRSPARNLSKASMPRDRQKHHGTANIGWLCLGS
jgi:hypothetical protein